MPQPDPVLKYLGESLREYRQGANISQRELAREVGISSKSVCNVEMGNNWPSLPVYVKIVRFLKPGAKMPFIPVA